MHELDSLRSMISKLSSSRTIPNLITQKLIIYLVMSEKWFIKLTLSFSQWNGTLQENIELLLSDTNEPTCKPVSRRPLWMAFCSPGLSLSRFRSPFLSRGYPPALGDLERSPASRPLNTSQHCGHWTSVFRCEWHLTQPFQWHRPLGSHQTEGIT